MINFLKKNLILILIFQLFCGSITYAEEKKFQDKKDESTGDLIVKYVANAAISFVGVSMPTKCKKTFFMTPSAMVFTASAAYYLLMEAMVMFQNKESKGSDLPAQIDRQGNFDQQIIDFQKAIEQTKKAREQVEKRAKNVKTAAVGMLAASGIAAVESIVYLVQLKNPTHPCKGEAHAPVCFGVMKCTKPEEKKEKEKKEKSSETESVEKKSSKRVEPTAEDKRKMQELMDETQPEYDQMKLKMIEEEKLLKEQGIIGPGTTHIKETFFRKFVRIFSLIDDAHAVSADMLGSVGSAIGGAVLGAAMGKIAAKLYEKPPVRIATFAAAGALAMMLGQQLDKKAKSLEDREKEYKRLIDELNNLKSKGQVALGTSDAISETNIAIDNKKLVESNQHSLSKNQKMANLPSQESSNQNTSVQYLEASEKICIDEQNNLDSSCNCLASNNCKKPILPNIGGNFQGFKMPEALTTAIDRLGQAANAFYQGKFAQANAHNQELTKMAAKIQKTNDQLYRKVEAELEKANLGKIDLDKQIQLALVDFDRTAKNGIKESGGLKNMLANTSAPNIIPGLSSDDQQKIFELDNSAFESENTHFGTSASENETGLLDENITGQDMQEAALEQYTLSDQGDIVKDNSASLFEVISVRYLKSAIPKLLVKEASSSN